MKLTLRLPAHRAGSVPVSAGGGLRLEMKGQVSFLPLDGLMWWDSGRMSAVKKQVGYILQSGQERDRYHSWQQPLLHPPPD